MSRSVLLSALLLSTFACSPARNAAGFLSDDAVLEGTRFEAGTQDEAYILWAANTLPYETLDEEVPLDRRAAENIVALRPFATVDELDAVPWVGTVALDRLHAYGMEHADIESPGPLDADALILWAANTLSYEVLDDDVGLDRRAAENIVAERPFDTLDALDAVSYVGPSALERLLAYAEEHHPQDPAVSPLRDVLLLRAANGLLLNQLHLELGWPRRAAARLINERPHFHADGLAGLAGVGDAEMEALESFAMAQWGAIGVQPHETDYRWCPDDDADEPNESPVRATPLRLDFPYRVDNHDPDWLSLTVEAGDTVTLWVEGTHDAVDAVLWSETLEPLVVGNDPRDHEMLVWTNDTGTDQSLYLEVVMGAFYGCAGYTVQRSDEPAPAEICGNGIDDDRDGTTDCGDLDCADACAEDCPIDTFEPNESANEAVLLGPDDRIDAFVPSYDVDWFTFEVRPGEELSLGGMGFFSWYTIFDADGEPVHYDDDLFGTAFANHSDQTQTYTLRVDNQFRACDSYVIETSTTSALACSSDAYTVEPGEAPTLVSSLTDEPLSAAVGEVDAVDVQLEEGEGLYVRAELPASYGLIEVRVVDPSGAERDAGFTFFDDRVELSVNDAEAGRWTVEVHPVDDVACAPYLLTVEPRQDEVVVQDDQEPNPDEERAGILVDSLAGAVLEGDVDVYQVNVEPRSWATVQVEGNASLAARLYDPSWSIEDIADLTDGSDTIELYNSRDRSYTYYLRLWSPTQSNYHLARD